MSERLFRNRFIRFIKKNYPKALLMPLSERYFSGYPDFLIIFPNGIHIFFELKTEKGKLSKLQEYTINKINSVDGRAYVVRSVEEARRICQCLIK